MKDLPTRLPTQRANEIAGLLPYSSARRFTRTLIDVGRYLVTPRQYEPSSTS